MTLNRVLIFFVVCAGLTMAFSVGVITGKKIPAPTTQPSFNSTSRTEKIAKVATRLSQIEDKTKWDAETVKELCKYLRWSMSEVYDLEKQVAAKKTTTKPAGRT